MASEKEKQERRWLGNNLWETETQKLKWKKVLEH